MPRGIDPEALLRFMGRVEQFPAVPAWNRFVGCSVKDENGACNATDPPEVRKSVEGKNPDRYNNSKGRNKGAFKYQAAQLVSGCQKGRGPGAHGAAVREDAIRGNPP